MCYYYSYQPRMTEYCICIQPVRAPRIRNKSLSVPDETSTSAAVTSGGESAAEQGLDHQSSPANRRRSAPVCPATPPPRTNTSPTINKKKLVHSHRPFSEILLLYFSCSGCNCNSIFFSLGASMQSRMYLKEDEFNNPSFIFLQLYNSNFLGDQKDLPILVPPNEVESLML